eukprot:TRINITY_DN2333_c0_g1_i1.p1 TRINITY_DN2333_c0_g1~~TRINITY_DN2333_c0_g1_i1.p1  ORF type:complete len:335 (+),score=78.17 TRINITY_DN2333_c0_g1_i1:54-1058(+)
MAMLRVLRPGLLRPVASGLTRRLYSGDASTEAASAQRLTQERQARRARLLRRIVCGKGKKRCWVSEASEAAYTGTLRGMRGGFAVLGRGLGSVTNTLVACAYTGRRVHHSAAVLFLGTVLAHCICAPTAPLNLAAGAILGPTLGAVVVVPAMLTGSVSAFLLGQTVASEYAAQCLASLDLPPTLFEPSVAVYTTWLLRICVLFPSGGVSYALGATPFDVYDFAVGTVAGQSITGWIFCHVGARMRVLSEGADVHSLAKRLGARMAIGWAVAVLGVFCVASLQQLGSLALPDGFLDADADGEADAAPDVPSAAPAVERQVASEVDALLNDNAAAA